ncbi:tetratricopeptide repeat protein [Pseudodesulfovibrio sp. JC047]|uniref:tetratricopeptide repeat protein n=1 Tax=Pseudodesulfovibrio sp. JC047 TaxID=2683199 RepID=UPI0013D16F32|nr:tetratricopeptide repeat protein [Pseudodesulfovibrio sp. JC047]NDV19644.1 tetratricopeptide repeat protein [Pseudodesulfovibrio sp. JC047]
MNVDNRLQGVFSIERRAKIGTGTTARRVAQSALYYAQEVDDEIILLQGLNTKHVPFGEVEEITKDQLLADYLPMPQLFKEVVGNLRKVQKSVARGDKFRKRGETFTAEYEYANALNLDEQNVRANFGIGLCLLARDETDKARKVFDRIIQIDSAFGQDHKHLFNEYGIALRKKKLIGQAVDYYRRALDLAVDDENLWYNLARAQFEREDWAKCGEAVSRCLDLDPAHPEGKKLLEYLTGKGLV